MFENFSMQLWFVLTAVFLILEVIFGLTIVFLFAALASFTLGFLIYFSIIASNHYVMQLAYFFGFTFFWTLICYLPLKKFLKKKNQDDYQNIVGSTAEVIENNLLYGKVGQVRWSGSIVKAKIAHDSAIHEIPVGRNVTIVEVKENIFIVKLR